jgi:hypothetical protein
MARYTCSYIVNLCLEDIQTCLKDIFNNCNCNLIYDTADYFMARENPGKIHFSRLVTIEVLPDNLNQENKLRLNFVVKNEELPLQRNNHCQQLFDLLQQIIAEDYQWKLEGEIAANNQNIFELRKNTLEIPQTEET